MKQCGTLGELLHDFVLRWFLGLSKVDEKGGEINKNWQIEKVYVLRKEIGEINIYYPKSNLILLT
jgi:hypothetical protein